MPGNPYRRDRLRYPTARRYRIVIAPIARKRHRLIGKEHPPARNRQIHISGRQFNASHNAARAFPGNQRRAATRKGLKHDLARVGIGAHQEIGQRHREHRRMLRLNPTPFVACDAQHGVGNAHVLHGLADMRVGLHLAIRGAQTTALVRRACPFAGDDLVGLPRHAIEVKNQFERRGQTPVPVTRQPRPLVPGVEAKATPAPRAHPFQPGFPIGLPFILAMNQAEID